MIEPGLFQKGAQRPSTLYRRMQKYFRENRGEILTLEDAATKFAASSEQVHRAANRLESPF